MRKFISFVHKEFQHILRDRRTMLILLGMPVVMILLFGFALSSEVKSVRIAVYDLSQSSFSRQLQQHIIQNDKLSIVEEVVSTQEGEKLMRAGLVDLLMVMPANLTLQEDREESIQLITDASDANMATLYANYVSQVIAQFLRYYDPLSVQQPLITPVVHFLYNPQMKASFNFVPGVMGMILMLICAMMTSLSIVREKELGSMEVLLSSPVNSWFIIISKTIPYLLLSCVNLLTILLLSYYLLHVPIAGSLSLLLFVSLLFILVSLSLGILISTLVTTQVAAMLMSGMVMMMPVMVFSGLIFPTDNMPWPLRYFSNIIPAKWYISAIRKVMIEGLSWSYIQQEILILSSMLSVLVGISILNFKNRLA